MRRLNIKEITGRYEIRYLKEDDIPAILSVCKGNPQFYLYTGAQCTKEQIKEDMKALPNDKEADDKYYFGFFQDGRLHAVMDLIDGYPDDATAFIGFFMLESAYAGKGEGTRIVAELLEYLKQNGFAKVRLCINKGNPQSTHFWHKTGFRDLFEAERDDGTVILAERNLG